MKLAAILTEVIGDLILRRARDLDLVVYNSSMIGNVV